MINESEVAVNETERRLAYLEKRNRRLTLFTFILGMGLVMLSLFEIIKSILPLETLRAKRLEILDRNGKTVILLGAYPEDNPIVPFLAFLDENSKVRLMLDSNPVSGTGLSIYGKEGYNIELSLSANPEKTGTYLTLYDSSSSRPRLSIGITSRENSAIALYDKDGLKSILFSVTPQGEPKLVLKDENGQTIFSKP